MSKSVYSLILNDEVISLVDKSARANGLSRSNMIEKILASALGYETPQIRATSIFDEIERLISSSNSMRYIAQPSSYMASILSAVDYRYNPAVKYSLELYPNSEFLGQLKVTLRTQNLNLISHIDNFFDYYTYLEKNYYNKNVKSEYLNGKFIRKFNYPNKNLSVKQLADVFTKYVKDLDILMNLYFANIGNENLLHIVADKFLSIKSQDIVI